MLTAKCRTTFEQLTKIGIFHHPPTAMIDMGGVWFSINYKAEQSLTTLMCVPRHETGRELFLQMTFEETLGTDLMVNKQWFHK